MKKVQMKLTDEHEDLLFVEVQDAKGRAINCGHVVLREDGHWVIVQMKPQKTMLKLRNFLNKINELLTGPTPEVGVGLGYEYVDLVLNRDGPPFMHEGLLFVEVQNGKGQAVNYGHVVRRDDGHWVIRIPDCRFDKLD